MMSLELVDHTQELECWRLPQQQHGARQLSPAPDRQLQPVEQPELLVVELSAE